MRIKAFRQKPDEPSEYPMFGLPFVTEMGEAGEDTWITRYYMIFLFRQCFGIELTKEPRA